MLLFFSQVTFILSIVGTFLSNKCSFIEKKGKKKCIHLEGTDYLLMEFLIKIFYLKPQTLNTVSCTTVINTPYNFLCFFRESTVSSN